MRHLLYIPVVHEFNGLLYSSGTADERKIMDVWNEKVIAPYFSVIADDLEKRSRDAPIHKLYIEGRTVGCQEIGRSDDRSDKTLLPVKCLMRNGARLMPTEHDILIRAIPRLVFNEKGIEGLMDLLENKVKMPISELFDKKSKTYLSGLKRYAEVCELFEGEEFLNIMRLRDKYIARNINRTLEDGERALLITGLLHDVPGLLKEIGSDIDILIDTKYADIMRKFVPFLQESE